MERPVKKHRNEKERIRQKKEKQITGNLCLNERKQKSKGKKGDQEKTYPIQFRIGSFLRCINVHNEESFKKIILFIELSTLWELEESTVNKILKKVH